MEQRLLFTEPAPDPEPGDWTTREKLLRELLEAEVTVVLNLKTDHNLLAWAKDRGLYVRVDRRTVWGNPFHIKPGCKRDAVCAMFAAYLSHPDRAGLLLRIGELKGKALGCHCAPEQCHGDHLAQLANQFRPTTVRKRKDR